MLRIELNSSQLHDTFKDDCVMSTYYLDIIFHTLLEHKAESMRAGLYHLEAFACLA